MRLGVHLSIKYGFTGALDQALLLGCEGFQIFAGNPRGWGRKPLEEQEYRDFKKKRVQTGIYPVVVHLSYLPNLASEDEELYQKSVTALLEDFQRANLLGADFLVFHPGKAKNSFPAIVAARVGNAVNEVLRKISGPTIMLFENQAGAGNEIAAHFEELALLVAQVNNKERIGLCFDTCHAFAAGYDLSTSSGWQNCLRQLQQCLGIDFLKLFHLNDSMGNLGSHLDRHQHIGQGQIGLPGFRFLSEHLTLREIPGILETPQQSPEDDQKNLATLRKLLNEV